MNADDFFGMNRREVTHAIAGRTFIVVLTTHKRGDYVSKVYQLVKGHRSVHAVRRQIWPAYAPNKNALQVLAALGADAKGWIAPA